MANIQILLSGSTIIVCQPRRAVDTSTNWRQSLFCCCTASMEQATNGAETAAIDGLVSSWSENISFSFCLRAPRYGLTLWCALGLLVGSAIQVPQLQLQLTLQVTVGYSQHVWLCENAGSNQWRVYSESFGHRLHTLTLVCRSTQSSTIRGQ